MEDMRDELKKGVNLDSLQREIDEQAKQDRYKEIKSNVKAKDLNNEDLMYVVRDAVQKILGSSLYGISLNPRIKNMERTENIENLNTCVLQSDVFNSLSEYLGNVSIKGENYIKIINLLSGKLSKESMADLVNNMQITARDGESVLVKKASQIKEESEKEK